MNLKEIIFQAKLSNEKTNIQTTDITIDKNKFLKICKFLLENNYKLIQVFPVDFEEVDNIKDIKEKLEEFTKFKEEDTYKRKFIDIFIFDTDDIYIIYDLRNISYLKDVAFRSFIRHMRSLKDNMKKISLYDIDI